MAQILSDPSAQAFVAAPLPYSAETRAYWDPMRLDPELSSTLNLPDEIGGIGTISSVNGTPFPIQPMGDGVGLFMPSGASNFLRSPIFNPAPLFPTGVATVMFVFQHTSASGSFAPIFRFQTNENNGDETALGYSAGNWHVFKDNGGSVGTFNPNQLFDTSVNFVDFRSYADGTFSLRINGGAMGTRAGTAGADPVATRNSFRLPQDIHRSRLMGPLWISDGDLDAADSNRIADYARAAYGIAIAPYA